MIKYHNAKDKYGNIVSIEEAVKGEPYSCISCGKKMIPKLGEIRDHHFCHKKEKGNELTNLCNEETYIHEYAKHYIKNLFDKRNEFVIAFERNSVCTNHNSCLYYNELLKKNDDFSNNDKCKGPLIKQINLKEYYDTCETEKGYNGFIADLLLSSKIHPEREPIFIEIAVSHRCEQEKLDSGIRIIEIFLPRNTDNLNSLRITEGEQKLQQKDDIVKIIFHNFNRFQKTDEPLNLFDINVYYTNLYNEDDSMLVRHKCSCFGKETLIKSAVCEIHYPINPKDYNKWQFIQNNNLSNVKTCWVCKHHSYDNYAHEHTCNTKRTIDQPTQAFHCTEFTIDELKTNIIKDRLKIMFCRSFGLKS